MDHVGLSEEPGSDKHKGKEKIHIKEMKSGKKYMNMNLYFKALPPHDFFAAHH